MSASFAPACTGSAVLGVELLCMMMMPGFWFTLPGEFADWEGLVLQGDSFVARAAALVAADFLSASLVGHVGCRGE